MMTDYIKRDALLEARELAICAYENAGVFNADAIRNHLKPLLDAVVDTPAADVAEVQKWINIKDRLPEPEQEVFVCVKSKISNYSYVCCAMHVPENWYRQSSDFCWDFECCDEYDEEQDDYIVKQGWYESIHNWDDYSVVGIEDIVTHWMPLPDTQKGESGGKE